jgi:hypothetical protein
MNAEKIIKALDYCLSNKGCYGCPYEDESYQCDITKDSLALIKEQQAKIEKLTEERDTFIKCAYMKQHLLESINEKLEHGYERSAARACAEMEMWHMISLREKKLTEENERLRAENKKLFDEAENQSNLWKQHFESLYETAKETVKADTITEICFRFAVHFSTYTENATVKIKHLFRFLDDMKKEMLEGKDGV